MTVDAVFYMKSHWSSPVKVGFYTENKTNGAFLQPNSQIVSFYFDLFNLLGKGHLSWTTLVLSKLLPVTVLDVTFHVILCVLFGNDATIAQSGSDYSLGVKARVVLMHFTIIRHCFGCGLASCCSYSCVQF